MKESFINRFIRTAIKADFKSSDSVPILRTPFFNIFGATIAEIDKMSRVGRIFEYLWYAFAGFITGFLTLAGLIIFFQPKNLAEIGWVGWAVFALIWLFSVIQFLSIVGYVRYKLRH